MTEDQLAVKLKKIIVNNSAFSTWTVSTPHLLLLVEQAVAEEREACAKIVEESSLPDAYSEPCLIEIANEIRARGHR